MTRSCLLTVEKIVAFLPERHLARMELEEWRGRVFLELPEDNAHLWEEAGEILGKHFHHSETFTAQVLAIWRGTSRESTTPPSLDDDRNLR